MKYDYIIVPVMETMRSTTLDRLNGFVKEGGKVILVGKAPERVDAVLSDKALLASSAWDKIDVDYSTLIDRLAPVRFVDFTDINLGTRCDDFVHQLRNDGDSKWLFLCHSEDLNKRRQHMPTEKYENVRIKLNGSFDVTEYNTVTGEIYTPAYEIKNGKTYLTYKLFTEDSLLLKLTPANEDKIVSGNAPRILLPFTSNTPVIKLPDDNGFTLDEPNSVLLDMCNYAFDGEEYTSEKVDSARIGDLGRARFYTKHQSQTSIQPWVPVPDELKNDSGHTVKRKFEFDTEIDIKGAYIALEMSDTARIFINGNEIEKKYCGWYVDECIVKVALPEIKKGHVTVEIETPFTLRGRTEWCYILGNFGVILSGKHLVVTDMPQTLAYGDITRQLLPFFTGNITYHIPFVEKDGTLPRTLQLTDFGGALAGVRLDGRDMGRIFISPFCIDLGTVTKGEHTLEITVFGTRFNNFGPIHNNVQGFRYLGPNSWKTYDSPSWNDNYLVKPAGILNNPVIY